MRNMGVIGGSRQWLCGRVGSSNGRWCKACPGCPPLRRPEGGLGGARLTAGGSEEGGREELVEFWLRRSVS